MSPSARPSPASDDIVARAARLANCADVEEEAATAVGGRAAEAPGENEGKADVSSISEVADECRGCHQDLAGKV